MSCPETLHAPPVEPFWPVTDWVPRVDLFPADPLQWNLRFLVTGVAAWFVAYRY